jgi:hypothetical protein
MLTLLVSGEQQSQIFHFNPSMHDIVYFFESWFLEIFIKNDHMHAFLFHLQFQ